MKFVNECGGQNTYNVFMSGISLVVIVIRANEYW